MSEGSTGRFHDVRRVERTASTNVDVLDLGRNGEPEGVVVVAGTQTAGRGRRGRSWLAPPGSGMLCSVLLRPPVAVADLVTATMAVAACDTIARLGITGVGIKWPNDLIVANEHDSHDGGTSPERKLAGILAEADWAPHSQASDGYGRPGKGERILVAAGIGLNVHRVANLPSDVAERRICVAELTDREVSVEALLTGFLESLDHHYTRLLDNPNALVEVWRGECVTLGRRVRIDLGNRDLIGVATGLDDRGRLVVTEDSGDEMVLAAGDVAHLRSTDETE